MCIWTVWSGPSFSIKAPGKMLVVVVVFVFLFFFNWKVLTVFLFLHKNISRVDRKAVASQTVIFPQYLISSPWRCYEDYNISFCKQWKFRCHCLYEQWHLNLHCLQRGQSYKGFQKYVLSYYSLALNPRYAVGMHLKRLTEALQMSTHNLCFREKM